jgi:hypothetical protein
MDGESLYARLAAAQAEMENPAFDKENPHFRNKFASLAAIRNAIVPPLAKHGLACVQVIEGGCVVTRVYGPDGSSIDLAGVPVTMGGTPQANGSELTYAKRYSLSAAFCVVGDEDDDGEAATQHWQARPAPRPVAAPAPAPVPQPPLSDTFKAELAALASQVDSKTGIGEGEAKRLIWDACKAGETEQDKRGLAGVAAMRLINKAASTAQTQEG